VITLPWGEIAALRSGFSNEVVANSGTKYQLWAIPVSLRARKRAARQQVRAGTEGTEGGSAQARRLGLRRGGFGLAAGPDSGPTQAETDQWMNDLRAFHERHEGRDTAHGETTVRWAYEVLGPALAGAVVLAILLATG
jgi:hypothetical protein